MKIACIVMASGHSKRFGEDKLLYPLDGSPIIAYTLSAFPLEQIHQALVVARDDKVLELSAGLGFVPVKNLDTTDDTAKTIRLGIETLDANIDGCIFSVGDQPWLSGDSVIGLIDAFSSNPRKIYSLAKNGRRGNPVIFPSSLFHSLKRLESGQSGRAVIKANPELLQLVEATGDKDLDDIDSKSDIL